MGEVYKASDTRLDRTVAIKVLPGHLTASPAARERLQREAHAVAALQHPNICTVHDVGEAADHQYFIVMELRLAFVRANGATGDALVVANSDGSSERVIASRRRPAWCRGLR